MRFNELEWIEYLRGKTGKSKSIFFGIGDDCAVIRQRGEWYLVTSDLFIEDVHFKLEEISFLNIGKRAAARAISDIAACGGIPRFVVVSAGIPRYVTAKGMKQVMRGIAETTRLCGASVIGGDTAGTEKLFLDVWVVGKTKKPVLRSRAKAGDYIFVTGKIGRLSFNKPFMPKLKEALYLVKNFKVNAMIDISDGFAIDLYRILQASSKGAVLYKDKVPVADSLKDIYRGEDYELIFTVDKSEPKIEMLKKKFYWVGYITQERRGYYFDNRGKKEQVKVRGFLHF